MSQLRKMQRQKQPLTKANKIAKKISMASKRANFLYQRVQIAIGDIKEDLNLYFTAISNIFTMYTLRKLMRMSDKDAREFINRYCDKSICITKDLVSYEDIIKYEIQEVDKEYSPLGWTDYKYSFHDIEAVGNSLGAKNAKTDNDLFHIIYRSKIINIAEGIFAAHELLVLSALHDYMGYGLKRCQRFIEHIRSLEYSSVEDVRKMIEWLEKRNFSYSDLTKFWKKESLWKLGLKDECLKACC